MNGALPAIALIGGTGDLGTGLARRWTAAGYPIILGSRSAAKAAEAAALLSGAVRARGLDNAAAAQAGEIVVVTVPFGSHTEILDQIRDAVAGKLVVDTTVPLMPPRVARVQLPPEDSAAVAAQKRLGDRARVVAAFHNVAALKLQKDMAIDCDVLVFGDDVKDRETVIALAQAAGGELIV